MSRPRYSEFPIYWADRDDPDGTVQVGYWSDDDPTRDLAAFIREMPNPHPGADDGCGDVVYDCILIGPDRMIRDHASFCEPDHAKNWAEPKMGAYRVEHLNMPEILVVVRGGMVQKVYGPYGQDIAVIDYDNDEGEQLSVETCFETPEHAHPDCLVVLASEQE